MRDQHKHIFQLNFILFLTDFAVDDIQFIDATPNVERSVSRIYVCIQNKDKM